VVNQTRRGQVGAARLVAPVQRQEEVARLVRLHSVPRACWSRKAGLRVRATRPCPSPPRFPSCRRRVTFSRENEGPSERRASSAWWAATGARCAERQVHVEGAQLLAVQGDDQDAEDHEPRPSRRATCNLRLSVYQSHVARHGVPLHVPGEQGHGEGLHGDRPPQPAGASFACRCSSQKPTGGAHVHRDSYGRFAAGQQGRRQHQPGLERLHAHGGLRPATEAGLVGETLRSFSASRSM